MSAATLAKKIGWIGTGVMGKSMARHLINQGYKLSVFNRTKSKTDELIDLGAEYKQPLEIAETSDILFLMLGYPQDLKNVLYEQGVIEAMKPGSVLVDHTTSMPELAVEIFEKCAERGIKSIDAPVSGGDLGAKNGQLVVMSGGEDQAFQEVLPILDVYSKSAMLMGPAGAGQNTKMVNQINIAGCMIGVCEGLVYGYKAGLDLKQVVELIGGGAAGSFSLNFYSPRIFERDMEPGFYAEHFLKDLEIALAECEVMGIQLPGLELARNLYKLLVEEMGSGRQGTQALIRVLEKMNEIEVEVN